MTKSVFQIMLKRRHAFVHVFDIEIKDVYCVIKYCIPQPKQHDFSSR